METGSDGWQVNVGRNKLAPEQIAKRSSVRWPAGTAQACSGLQWLDEILSFASNEPEWHSGELRWGFAGQIWVFLGFLGAEPRETRFCL